MDFVKVFGEYALSKGEDWRCGEGAELMDAYENTLSAAPVAVKVRKLEWTALDDDHWGVTSLGLSYEIRRSQLTGSVRIRGSRNIHDGFMDFDGTVEEAKAAAQADYERRILSALEPTPAEPVGSIVPEHCSGSTFVFVNGVLHVSKDGSGYIVVDEDDFELEDDRCEGPDGPEGSVHWITRFPADTMTELRDFLNGERFPDSASRISALEAEVGRLREALNYIDALDPESHMLGFSADALRGIVSRIGERARAALADKKGGA